MTMEELESAILTLERCIASGVLTVRTGDHQVTYNDAAALTKQLLRLRSERDKLMGLNVTRRTAAGYDSGLHPRRTQWY